MINKLFKKLYLDYIDDLIYYIFLESPTINAQIIQKKLINLI